MPDWLWYAMAQGVTKEKIEEMQSETKAAYEKAKGENPDSKNS